MAWQPHPDASEVWRDGGEAGPADPTREAAQLLLKEGQKFLEVEHKELLVTVPAGCSEGQKFCMQSPHGGLFNFTVRAGVSAGQQMRVRVPAQQPLTLEVVGDMLSRQQPDAEETAAEAERLGCAYACHSDSTPLLPLIKSLARFSGYPSLRLR